MDFRKHSFKILEALALPVLVIDRDYRVMGANRAACRLFCLSTEDIVGRQCFKIAHQLDRPCWHEGTGCPAKTAFELREQTRVIHEHSHGGKTIFEEVTASPVFDDNGEVEFVVEELNNVTELIQSKEIAGHLRKDIKTLQGLLPICSRCKDIRDEEGYWNQIENYISDHAEVHFSHSLCEKCTEELYGQEKWYIKMKKKRENRDKES
jgi:PAS domain S-box-containing protein